MRKCKRAYILPRGSGRGAAEVRKRGGKTGSQLAVPTVCDGGRSLRSARTERQRSCGPPRAEAAARAAHKSRKPSPQDHPPGHRRPARLSKEPQTVPAEPPIAKIGRNPLNDIVTVLRPNAITSSARGLRPHVIVFHGLRIGLLLRHNPFISQRSNYDLFVVGQYAHNIIQCQNFININHNYRT